MSFSEVVELPAGDIVVKMLPSEAKMPEDLPHGAPELKVPENIDDFYILVSEDKSNKCLPLALKLIDAGEGKLKPGETLWINLTEHRIEADLEGARMTIAPEGQTVSKAPLPDSGYYRAEFSYQLNGEGELQRMTEQSWWHDAKSRHLGFIQDTGGKHPKVYFYRDFR
ncbi:hypothetical protein HZ994_01760 [Akkermansiaceae bacterium]|nr:hypothetical protein HZ994_01760 [Akkermansiaceae bacterium]